MQYRGLRRVKLDTFIMCFKTRKVFARSVVVSLTCTYSSPGGTLVAIFVACSVRKN